MALTLEKLQNLEDASLTRLFAQRRDLWREKVVRAYHATQEFIASSGAQVRPDDVLPLLMPQLAVSRELRDYLSAKKLRGKKWPESFAEYIVDQFWSELQGR